VQAACRRHAARSWAPVDACGGVVAWWRVEDVPALTWNGYVGANAVSATPFGCHVRPCASRFCTAEVLFALHGRDSAVTLREWPLRLLQF